MIVYCTHAVPDRPMITVINSEVRTLVVSWTYTNPPLNEGPVITGYYVYLDGQRIPTRIHITQFNISGLTPFTNYTVEVSAFNTGRDGSEQEGPRSDPRTGVTLGERT